MVEICLVVVDYLVSPWKFWEHVEIWLWSDETDIYESKPSICNYNVGNSSAAEINLIPIENQLIKI